MNLKQRKIKLEKYFSKSSRKVFKNKKTEVKVKNKNTRYLCPIHPELWSLNIVLKKE